MGLDMYLHGKKFLWTNWDDPKKNITEDGFRLQEKVLQLGYWRKHPNLHGYIVQTFANGVDECQPIPLEQGDLEKILAAVEADDLPTTTGFFFGESTPEDRTDSIKILKAAIKWVKTEETGVARSVEYRASW